MTQLTTILENESGFQYGGVKDGSTETGYYPIQGLIVGYFRRGRFDKPMTITQANIRGVLGFDFQNPYYRIVQDVLNEGIPSVQVLRLLKSSKPIPTVPTVPTAPKDEHQLQEFDYAVVRYLWTDQGGQDLDTRTLIIDPPRHVVVGWNRQGADESFLNWVGDNTGSGVESVLINLNHLKQAYPNKKTFGFQFKAFWFSRINNGKFILQVETYKGGQMVTDGFDYVNVDGRPIQNLTMECLVGASPDYEGYAVAELALNTESQTGEFVKTSGNGQRVINIANSLGRSVFNNNIMYLKLMNEKGRILYDGVNQADSLILRNTANRILFER